MSSSAPRRSSSWIPHLFVAPYVGLTLVFFAYPFFDALLLAFQQTNGPVTRVFVGLDNFRFLAGNADFHTALRNTAILAVANVVLLLPLSLALALLLNAGTSRLKGLIRLVLFSPHLVGQVFVGILFAVILVPRYGLLTNFLNSIGLSGLAVIPWTAPEHLFWSMLVGLVWISAGFFTILILAGADKIPTDMYDAARIEGATNRQMFRFITLPMIWDVIMITLILWVIEAIRMMEYPYAFGGPNIDQNLYTPAIYLFIMGFGQRQPVYELGYATAIGVAMFVFTALAVDVIGALTRRERVEF